MSQEKLNVILVILPIAIPFVQFLLQKFFSRKKDSTEYGSDLLELLNSATDALRKSREENTTLEVGYEKTITTVRQEHKAAMDSMRSEYDGRIGRLRNRVEELEKVQRIYEIQFNLITHPNVEIRDVRAKAMDDVTASQKMKTITDAPKTEAKTEG